MFPTLKGDRRDAAALLQDIVNLVQLCSLQITDERAFIEISPHSSKVLGPDRTRVHHVFAQKCLAVGEK